MGRNNTYLIAICALVLLAAVIIYTQSAQKPHSTPTAHTPAAGTAGPMAPHAALPPAVRETAETGAAPALPKSGQSFIDLTVAQQPPESGVYPVADAPETLGAQHTTLPAGGQSLVFRVLLISEGRCMEGDLDIIRQEMKDSPEAKLLITLEPVLPGDAGVDSFAPQAQEIALSSLQAGTAFSFPLSPSASTRHLGLFICKDTQGKNRCAGKQVVDLAGRSGLGQPVAGGDKADKIYFFEYFMLQDNGITAFDNEKLLRAGADLERYLANRSGQQDEARKVAASVHRINSAVRSISARLSPDTILVNLPRYERGVCMKEGIELPVDKLKEQLKKKKQMDRR